MPVSPFCVMASPRRKPAAAPLSSSGRRNEKTLRAPDKQAHGASRTINAVPPMFGRRFCLPSRSSLTRTTAETTHGKTARFISAAWKRMPRSRPARRLSAGDRLSLSERLACGGCSSAMPLRGLYHHPSQKSTGGQAALPPNKKRAPCGAPSLRVKHLP